MLNRDPLFAVRRTARNLQRGAAAVLFGELNALSPVSDKPLHIVFVHGGLSCCFDAFADLFPRIEASLVELGDAPPLVSLLRFEHDTYQGIRVNAERLCDLVTQKLAQQGAGAAQPELLFIAHSRGGLVARLASDLLIERGHWGRDRLEVFTYGSPHRGTPFFESEVTFMVDRLIRWAGIAGFSVMRFVHDLRRRGPLRTLRRNFHALRRAGVLMGLGSGSSTLALRRMISGRRSGGVTVRGQGRGGRNAEFLLALGLALQGLDHVHAIACDTDGIDGTEDNAGALLGPDSLTRAAALGLDPRALLADNDGYRFFEALGDLVVTGPSRTNVNDFRAILIERP